MKNKLNYSTQDYFPSNVKIIGILLLLGGLMSFAIDNMIGSIVMLMIAFVIFTTKYGIEIDLDNKTYKDYLMFFGYKKGDSINFHYIDSLYMTKGSKTTTMQLRGAKTTITKDEYNAYLKFSEDEKVHLLSSEKKEEVEKLLKQISKDTNIEMEDYSNENQRE